MEGEAFKKIKPTCLTTREYTKLLVFSKIHSNNIDIKSVTMNIMDIVRSDSVCATRRFYKESMEKTKALPCCRDIKQDLYGLSHIAYISKLNELSS